MEKKSDKYFIIFLFLLAAYALFSFSAMNDFGITWDEPPQHFIGQVTSDYVRGNSQNLDSLGGDLVYYGPFFEVMNQGFGTAMAESFRMSYINAFHVLIILAALAGLFFFFKLVSLMLEKRTALFASALLMLHPIFFAHSQYNSKDIPLLAGFVITLYFLYSGFKERKFWKIILAGLLFGLTLDIRIDGLLLFPVFFLSYAFFALFGLKTESQKEWTSHLKKDLLFLFSFLFASALAVYAAWPALWRAPLFFFKAVNYFFHHQWPGLALYFGKEYSGTALPWHYALFHLAATTPFLIFIFSALGIFLAIQKIRRGEKIFELTLIFLWLFLRLALALFPQSVKYDGVRHFLVILPALFILAALGFDYILERIPGWFPKIEKLKFQSAILAFVFLWLAVEFFWIYPFGGAYYNETVRIAFPRSIEKKFDFEYWGASYRQGINWLNNFAGSETSFCVPVAQHLLQFYPIRKDLKFDCTENTNYLMFIARWAYLPKDLEQTFHFSEKEPVYRLSRYNSDLLVIYKLK